MMRSVFISIAYTNTPHKWRYNSLHTHTHKIHLPIKNKMRKIMKKKTNAFAAPRASLALKQNKQKMN